jgi:4-hydroxybenzoate polyprenyltransferase
MIALQASIGALNDRIDAPRDAGRKPGKPIPAGRVSADQAAVVIVGAAGVGIAIAAPSGSMMVILAVAVLAIGYGYDMLFKGTAWSWLPFAVGIPLLPVFGWLGSAGSLPGAFALLVPVAVIAGAALAIANARADTERDLAAGLDSVAVRLGTDASWAVNAGLLLPVVTVAIATLVATHEAPSATLAVAVGAGLVVGTGVVIGRGGDSARREKAWELEAVGLGLLAAAWLAGVRLGG